jgi:hypothetical protein
MILVTITENIEFFEKNLSEICNLSGYVASIKVSPPLLKDVGNGVELILPIYSVEIDFSSKKFSYLKNMEHGKCDCCGTPDTIHRFLLRKKVKRSAPRYKNMCYSCLDSYQIEEVNRLAELVQKIYRIWDTELSGFKRRIDAKTVIALSYEEVTENGFGGKQTCEVVKTAYLEGSKFSHFADQNELDQSIIMFCSWDIKSDPRVNDKNKNDFLEVLNRVKTNNVYYSDLDTIVFLVYLFFCTKEPKRLNKPIIENDVIVVDIEQVLVKHDIYGVFYVYVATYDCGRVVFKSRKNLNLLVGRTCAIRVSNVKVIKRNIELFDNLFLQHSFVVKAKLI